MDTFETPDLACMSTDDLCGMMLACGASDDPSDKMFAKACRDELAKRKPEMTASSRNAQIQVPQGGVGAEDQSD